MDGKYDGSKSFKFEWFEGKIRISRIGYPECYYDVSLNDKGYVRASEQTGNSKVSYAFEYNDAGFLSSVERTINSEAKRAYWLSQALTGGFHIVMNMTYHLIPVRII